MQARTAQRDDRVARNHQGEYEISNDSEHRHIVGKEREVSLDSLNNASEIVKPLCSRSAFEEAIELLRAGEPVERRLKVRAYNANVVRPATAPMTCTGCAAFWE